ncbi:hypothetical protein LF1_55530 [Rubripirellula obstinata]|uniref:Uncharacterized protein n=1 Tax=Rubripirellula obstinata TaxID=406547 RepID=A0A5B1CCM7_9BACT|nr:hypothetical protein [Rubripirellula obstinata]KAA1257153.1 hypothetical protein LF1_55530 [Rubripirellula obstinata]
MTVQQTNGTVIVKDDASHAASISVWILLFAALTCWATYRLLGVYATLLVGLPIASLLVLLAVSPLLYTRQTEFDRKAKTIRIVATGLTGSRSATFRFSDFSRIAIRERTVVSTQTTTTFYVFLKRRADLKAAVPKVLQLCMEFEEQCAWAVVDAVCSATGIPKPRDVKYDGAKRRGFGRNTQQ